MNKIKNYLLGLVCFVAISCMFVACSNDDLDTNQYKGGVSLNVFGPSPVMRGGELRFIGSGMDQITAVVIPGCSDITDIKVVSSNEIRVTVPQDAEPGLVTLKYANGTITTITQLTFEEPIILDDLTPNPVKPGKQLTITGDYLNLIKTVILSEEVAVPESEFIQHDRKTIVLTVPEEAQTGQIILSDALPEEEEAGLIPNYIYSEDELQVVLPSAYAAVDLTSAKPGDIIEIKGSDLDLVKKIVMPSGEELAFEYINDENGESIVFTLPVGATDGAIVMIPASGVKVAIANLGMALPEQLEATPSSGLREGDEVTIKGVNMELVTDITFPGAAENVAPTEQSATQLKVVVPAGTVSGDVLLNTASGTSVSVAIETQKPEFTAFASAEVSLGNDVVIQGKNLDLVVKVIYTGGAEVEVEPTSSTELTVSMPSSGAESGKLTLVMANGESSETGELTINAPEFCYATELPDTEETEIKAGGAVTLTVTNSDKLTGVQVNGTDVQYILTSDNQLIIGVPQNAGKNSTFTLISSNGSISYSIKVTPASEVTTVLWTGLVDLASWSLNYEFTPNDMFVGKDVKAGDKLLIYATAYNDWWQIQLYTGHWNGFEMADYDNSNNINTGNDNIFAANGYFEITIDDALATALQNDIDWGYAFIAMGEGLVITKVALFQTVSFEQTLWKGTQDLGTWSINWELPADLFSSVIGTVKAGQTLRIYGNATSDWWQVQMFDGHWGGLSSMGDTFGNGNNVNAGIYDLDANGGCITINVTAEMAELFNTYTDWGYCGIIQGENFVVTKITIE